MTVYVPGNEIAISINEATGEEIMAPAFTYGANVTDNGGAYQGAYISTDYELIQLGGMLRTTAPVPVNGVLITLATVLAPHANEMTQIEINGVSYAAEIDVNGTLTTKVAIGTGGTISLNSIRFLNQAVYAYVPPEEPVAESPETPYIGTTHAFTAAELLSGTTIYGSTWEVPGYRVGFDGQVKMFGLIKIPANNQASFTIFKLPAALAPLKQRIFTVQVGTDTAQVRVDIQTTGDAVVRCSGNSALNFLSLEGISFYPNSLIV